MVTRIDKHVISKTQNLLRKLPCREKNVFALGIEQLSDPALAGEW